jgi:HD superfamily phosphohydrolase YqeK
LKRLSISDFIEPGRKEFPGLIKARKLAYEDIDKSLIKVLLLSINHLVDQEKPIDPVTEQAYEYYYQRYNEKVV